MKKIKFSKDGFLFLLAASFVFLATSSLTLSKYSSIEPINLSKTFSVKDFPPIPVLAGEVNSFPIFSAQAILAVDLESGLTLFEKNADISHLPASTTKIMTALVAMDHYKNNDVLVVNGISVEGQKMGLVSGEEILFEDLLHGLLIYSANDAAEVMAHNYCKFESEEEFCGREYFVEAMNAKAKEMHLTNTSFKNPSGLDDVGHNSTARDLVRISKVAMRSELFAKIVSTKEYVAESVDGKISHKLVNINELIGEVDGVLGVKTGWTENARENLVTYIERGDRRVMIALLGSQDRFGETKELIDWMFENYEWKEISLSN